MIKFIQLFLALHLTPLICISQNAITHDFIGYVITSSQQKIDFKLSITKINSNGSFNGYTYTNYKSKDYTKSTIEGQINSNDNKSISFKELTNTETTSEAKSTSFCYIAAKNLKLSQTNNKNVLAGNFEGTFPSGEKCASGTIILTNTDDTNIIFNPPTQKKYIEKDSPNSDSIFSSSEILLVKQWENNTLLEIWDNNIEDGDIVSVYIDNKIVKDSLTLKHQKYLINLPGNKDVFSIKIIALNEGKTGKNTITFRIKNAGILKNYIAELNTNQSFNIEFKKEL